jgi:hypothetical protein
MLSFWDSSSCINAGGAWDKIDYWGSYGCFADSPQGAALLEDPWQCFAPGKSVCPDPMNNTKAYSPGETIPAYSWRDNWCQAGCYLPQLSENDCASKGWPYTWLPEAANDDGSCMIPVWYADEATCTALGSDIGAGIAGSDSVSGNSSSSSGSVSSSEGDDHTGSQATRRLSKDESRKSIWVPNAIRFNLGQFSSEDQCNQGICQGTVDP